MSMSISQGLLYLAACLPIGVVGLVSARHQGRTSVASIGIVAKKPEQFGKAMLFPAMVETYAIPFSSDFFPGSKRNPGIVKRNQK